MKSVYVIVFKPDGNLDDLEVYTSYERALERLRRRWRTTTMLEYRLDEDGMSNKVHAMYDMLEDGSISKHLY
jgi:hypothetical protein